MSKKLMVIVLSIVMVFTLAFMTGCGSSDNGGDKEVVKIGIIQLMEHPSLNMIKDAIIEGLETEGYVDGDNAVIDVQNGQNDMSTMKTIAQKFVNDEVDVIIAIATPAAQAALSETEDIPIIFAAISDPVGAGLVDDPTKPGGNVTGTSDELSPEMIMNLAKTLTGDFKTIGALYSAGEDNSVSTVKALKEYADKNGYTVVESSFTNSSEVQQAAQYLADKVDIVFTGTDNTVASSMAVVSKVFNENGIPFYVGADTMVQDGGLATYGIDYVILGHETANMVAKVFAGEDTATMPVRTMTDMSIYINKTTAAELGVDIPADIESKAVFFE